MYSLSCKIAMRRCHCSNKSMHIMHIDKKSEAVVASLIHENLMLQKRL